MAILLYVLHALTISIILLGVGSSSNKYVLFIAFLNPKSVTGNRSFQQDKISKIVLLSILLYLLLLLAGLLLLHLASLVGQSSLTCSQQSELQDPWDTLSSFLIVRLEFSVQDLNSKWFVLVSESDSWNMPRTYCKWKWRSEVVDRLLPLSTPEMNLFYLQGKTSKVVPHILCSSMSTHHGYCCIIVFSN